MGSFEETNVRVLELIISPKFALMKQVVLNVNSAFSTMPSNSSNINNRFWIPFLFTWIVKEEQVLRTVFLTNL